MVYQFACNKDYILGHKTKYGKRKQSLIILSLYIMRVPLSPSSIIFWCRPKGGDALWLGR